MERTAGIESSPEEIEVFYRVCSAIESDEPSGVLKDRPASVCSIFSFSLRLRSNNVHSAVRL